MSTNPARMTACRARDEPDVAEMSLERRNPRLQTAGIYTERSPGLGEYLNKWIDDAVPLILVAHMRRCSVQSPRLEIEYRAKPPWVRRGSRVPAARCCAVRLTGPRRSLI